MKPTSTIRLVLLSVLAATASTSATASYATKTAPAPSGITDDEVANQPLETLTSRFSKIARERSRQKHRYGDVVHVTFEYDDLLTDAQWKVFADRTANAIEHADPDRFINACVAVDYLRSQVYRDNDLAGVYQFPRIINAAISRLHDPDLQIVRRACTIVGMYSSDAGLTIPLDRVLDLAQTAPSKEHTILILDAVWMYKVHVQEPSPADLKLVEIARRVLDDPDSTRDHRLKAILSMSRAHGASRQAAELAAREYHQDPPTDERVAILVLTNLCSIYENHTPESRAAALPIALPVFIHAVNSNDWAIQTSAAGAARHIEAQAEPFVPALITMLDHPDPNIVWIALSALGSIGEPAEPAVPKIRDLYKRFPEDQHEAMDDALYLITKQGPKPDWYDRFIQQRNEAMGHETPAP